MIYVNFPLHHEFLSPQVLEVVDVDGRVELVSELNGSIIRCACDQNGNHVIQKCIECIPQDRVRFITDALRGHVLNLSLDPYGCRVIQVCKVFWGFKS